MTKEELEARLLAEGFGRDVYGLDGSPPTYEGLSLTNTGRRWIIEYVERGIRREVESFESEGDACDRMYELLSEDFRR